MLLAIRQNAFLFAIELGVKTHRARPFETLLNARSPESSLLALRSSSRRLALSSPGCTASPVASSFTQATNSDAKADSRQSTPLPTLDFQNSSSMTSNGIPSRTHIPKRFAGRTCLLWGRRGGLCLAPVCMTPFRGHTYRFRLTCLAARVRHTGFRSGGRTTTPFSGLKIEH